MRPSANFDRVDPVGGDLEDTGVGDDPVDASSACQGQCAFVDDLRTAVAAVWSMRTKTRRAPCTRSITLPIPLIIFPEMAQLASSPTAETYMPPSTATSRCVVATTLSITLPPVLARSSR